MRVNLALNFLNFSGYVTVASIGTNLILFVFEYSRPPQYRR